ncbi:ATP-binding protein [Mucilaginibacter sp. UR6-11]|uniref:tetratricopeptide repeat-containing hybrid sensor histidine kinase/response regulator n=1 Tax=Mucilaginibacter sp. UR6-11 TaxID=1435644 RepID=UPI001E63A5D2|nr:ATP-binding protein [Mucilaginibacter sp. UR6-11]MCC8424667.1 tetratricopeptide repeat protein [Mucilaginibacter sp. UR6-11]
MKLPLQQDDHQRVMSLLDEAYACRTNNLKRSTALAREALSLSQKLNEIGLVAKSLSHAALFAMILGEYESALDMSAQAIKIYESLNDDKGIADAKYNIAGVYYKTNNYHLGLVNLVDCINTYRKYNDYHNLARSHKSLGTVYEYFGDEKNAIITYEDSIDAAKKAGDLNLESNAYNPLSGIYLKKQDIKMASELIEMSIAMKTQTSDIRGLAFAYYGRGKVYTAKKQFAKAEDDFKASINIHLAMGETLGLGMAYHKLASLYVLMGQLAQAKEVLQKGLDFSTEYHLSMVKFKCYHLFYDIFKLENDPINALKFLELYLKERESVINAQTLKVIENYDLINKMEAIKKEAQLQLEKAEIIEKKNLAEQTAIVKQEFLSTMSHEIRTPLNAIITIASLLSDKTDKEEQELINALRFASNSLLLLINDILDFTKLEAGKTSLEMRPADFKQLLNNIKKTYESLAREKGLVLDLKIDNRLADSYELDENKLGQILGNLITNAIKFTYFGQVDIITEKISTTGYKDTIRFKVNDTGIGIAPNYLQDIFESFSQPQSITTKKQGGSGLGLAIVKKLVNLHGSDILVTSTEGIGSSFYFDLRLKKAESPDKPFSKHTESLKGKTILLAEDNVINAMVITKLLSNWKVKTEHVKNGFEAVEKTKQKAFDFILMDIHMPEMDGFQATKNIISAADNPNKKTPIFALTADVTAEYQTEFHSYFTGFLRKPIEVEKLYDALLDSIRR